MIPALVLAALNASLLPATHAKDGPKTSARHRPAAIRPAELPSTSMLDDAAARVGLASVYSRKLVGRRMANGAPMRLDRPYAASPTLPLGTAAIVTNLDNGQRTVVQITDRGPFVRGRIIDLTPHSARQLGIGHLARVEVAPMGQSTQGRAGLDIALAATGFEASEPLP